MTLTDAITTLKRHEADLRARGVSRAAVFGSVARGEAKAGSDLDILIDLETAARLDVFDYVGLKRFIAELFEGPVDVVTRDALKPALRGGVDREATYAF